MRYRYKLPSAVAAKVRDPSVICAAVGLREIRVIHLRLPQNPDCRIQNGFVEALMIEQFDSLARIQAMKYSSAAP